MEIATAKEAASKALEYTAELIPDAKYAALEGISLDETTNSWRVIIGFVRQSDVPFSAVAALGAAEKRVYKIMVLSARDLALIKMEPYALGD